MIFIIFIYLAHYFTTHTTNNKYQKGTNELGKRKRESVENKVVREAGSSSRNVIDQCVVSVPIELLQPKWPRISFDSVASHSLTTLS